MCLPVIGRGPATPMSITWCWHRGRPPLKPRSRARVSILFFRQKRQRMDLDTLLHQRTCILGRCLPIDAAFLHFLIVDAPRFLREAVAHIIGGILHMFLKLAHFLHELSHSRIAARHHRIAGLGFPVGFAAYAGRHQLLVDLARRAYRAADRAVVALLVIGRAAAEPAVENMPVLAYEIIADHGTSSKVASARTSPNLRAWLRAGIRLRADMARVRSISAVTTQGAVPPSPMISPQGPMMRLWP